MKSMGRFVVVINLLLMAALVVVGSVLAYAYPSTNDANRTRGRHYVEQVSMSEGETELRFVNPRAWWACYEYRTDGDTSQALGTPNPNTQVADRYPHLCVNNNTLTQTFQAIAFVEIRSTFGAERDDDFDWTRFDVIPVPPTPEPTAEPTVEPTVEPTAEPTQEPEETQEPGEPTAEPTAQPTAEPTQVPPGTAVPATPVPPPAPVWASSGVELMPLVFTNSEHFGKALQIFWVTPEGEAHLVHSGNVGEFGDVSLVVPAGNYPANPGYGQFQTDDPDNPVISVWGRFVAIVGGVTVQDIVVAECAGLACEPRSYLVGGDEVNQSPRPSSVLRRALRSAQ